MELCRKKRKICTKIICIFLACLVSFVFFGDRTVAWSRTGELIVYKSLNDIPGITGDEISAVNDLREHVDSFVYGMYPSAETFINENGEIGGFSALLCNWLTELFGIRFTPALYERTDLPAGLESGRIDFTGELTATDELRQIYLMTGAIAGRPVKYMRISGSMPLSGIAAARAPRYAFLRSNAAIADEVAAVIDHTFETVYADNCEHAYTLLKNGQADAFLNESSSEFAFDVYDDVISENFFPMIRIPVSLSTQNDKLQPVIAVLQKALENGSTRHISELYKRGQQEYRKHKLFIKLNDEERAYMRSHRVIPFASEHYNYPVSFYNTHEKQWQGIFFDLLQEVETLTGLSFRRVNDQYADWPVLLKLLETGEASMISELLYSKEREGRFLWPATATLTDQYALLSKSGTVNVGIDDVWNMKVGLTKDTVYTELFRAWFPDHENTVEYDSSDAAFNALDRGEIDLVMSSQRRLLALSSYHELSGYKSNLVFDRASRSVIGFNKDQAVLRSIVDKAFRIIDVKSISEHWVDKTYDYKAKLANERRPWLVGVSALFLCVIVLLFVLFQIKRNQGRKLEDLVQKRTFALDRQLTLMGVVNDAAVLLLESNDEDYLDALNTSMDIICEHMDADRVYLWQNIRKDDGKLYYRQICKRTIKEEFKMTDRLSEFAYCDTLPAWEALLSSGEIFNGPLDGLPEGDKTFFEAYKLQSLLVVPLFLNGEFWGFVSFDDCRRRRVFPEAEEYTLRSWGLLAVGVIKRGEIALDMRNTVKKLEAVTSNYKGVIWSVDNNGIITTFNGQYLKTIGVEPSFLEGKKLEAARHKNRHLDIIENVEKTFREGPQDWIGGIDGGMFHSYTTPIHDSHDNVIGVVGSTDDVTEMIRLQQDLEAAVETANAANQSKSAFLANMSHEIRTPMNAILGITEIQLQNKTLATGAAEAFSKIYSSGDLLLGIINDLLDMSKIDAGKLELTPARYETASLINDTVTLNMMRIGSKPIEFGLHVDENTPLTLLGDELRIKQILNNLLSNAFKYTEKGEVRLAVFAETGREEEESAVMLVLRVSDTGQGMTKEQVQKLFDQYARFNVETNRTTEGTGLGMSITRNLIRMMNGEIFVESEVNKGTTITVRLPQESVGQGVIGRELAENLHQFRVTSAKQIIKSQIVYEPMPYGSVLVVDDVETNLYVAKGLMLPYELSVETAASGFEAIEKIKSGKVYDIIFMDHMMPKMDGMEATKIIRDSGYEQPIVALTANALAGQADVFLKNGFDEFISKPIDIRQLNASLKKLIRDKQPPEVIEAVKRERGGAGKEDAMNNEETQPSISPQLAAIFIRDLSKSLLVLEEVRSKLDALGDEDLRMYTITVHAMKSVLANIGETELSKTAQKLENAGRERDVDVITAETPAFLNSLRALMEKFTPKEKKTEDVEVSNENQPYLQEKLFVIKAACEEYDKETAKSALAELRRKTWPPRIEEALGSIAEHLLHSDFEEAAQVVGSIRNSS